MVNFFCPFLYEGCTKSNSLLTVMTYIGRHRCIGEIFAYLQMKTIWAVLIRRFEFSLVDSYFPTVNHNSLIHTPKNPVIAYKRRGNTPTVLS